ncbi:peptidoglycan-associated lipoprotein Pal [Desulfobacterales bacterium HSG16]|nr:peptidoglycan-associated lipoprotein Pal [Desulfobacterales bacterium HSG16]
MQGKFMRSLVFLLVIVGFMFMTSCTPKKIKVGGEEQPGTSESEIITPNQKSSTDNDSKDYYVKPDTSNDERLKAEAERRRRKEQEMARREGKYTEAKEAFTGNIIYFDYDSAALRPDTIALLNGKVDFLNQYPGEKILIEGHCDGQGTSEYNLALGDRRARSVKAFFINNGIANARIRIISYGEEKPAVDGNDEAAWSKNRRAEFVIK